MLLLDCVEVKWAFFCLSDLYVFSEKGILNTDFSISVGFHLCFIFPVDVVMGIQGQRVMFLLWNESSV